MWAPTIRPFSGSMSSRYCGLVTLTGRCVELCWRSSPPREAPITLWPTDTDRGPCGRAAWVDAPESGDVAPPNPRRGGPDDPLPLEQTPAALAVATALAWRSGGGLATIGG